MIALESLYYYNNVFSIEQVIINTMDDRLNASHPGRIKYGYDVPAFINVIDHVLPYRQYC